MRLATTLSPAVAAPAHARLEVVRPAETTLSGNDLRTRGRYRGSPRGLAPSGAQTNTGLSP